MAQRRPFPLLRRPRRGSICQRTEALICVAPIATGTGPSRKLSQAEEATSKSSTH